MAFSPQHQQIVQSLLHPSADTPHPRPADRRLRIVFNGVYIVDTTQAAFVWEHPYFPQFYVPGEALKNNNKGAAGAAVVEVQEGAEVAVDGGKAQIWKVVVAGKGGDKNSTKKSFEGLYFKEGEWIGGRSGKANVEGLLRVNFRDMDAWYEEDSQIYGHPKDPTKRIFLLPSSRPLVIKIGSHTLVDTTATSGSPTSYIHLIEPLLPVRYYLPPTAVASPDLLRPSSTRSVCPYKGEAEYYDVVVKGEGGKEEVHRDLVWYYRYPTLECSAVAGLLCFYNEKVDVWLDGEKLERPKSKFA